MVWSQYSRKLDPTSTVLSMLEQWFRYRADQNRFPGTGRVMSRHRFSCRAQHIKTDTVVKAQSSAYYDSGSGTELIMTVSQEQSSEYYDSGSGTELIIL
jgi:hypothetical protein